jgi:Domain of unknown function (DUF4437)
MHLGSASAAHDAAEGCGAADTAGNMMIVEIPDPACVDSTSLSAAAIAHARAQFDARLVATMSWKMPSPPIPVYGAGHGSEEHIMRMSKIGLGIAFVTVAGISFVAGAKTAKAPIMRTPAEEKWEPPAPGLPLQKVALWGDRDKGGDYAMLLKLPANTPSLGMHMHTHDYYGVAIQGTWIHTIDGGETKKMGPGGYVFQPGKQYHDDGCEGATECIVFIHQHAKGDFLPKKEAAAKPAEKPAEKPATK